MLTAPFDLPFSPQTLTVFRFILPQPVIIAGASSTLQSAIVYDPTPMLKQLCLAFKSSSLKTPFFLVILFHLPFWLDQSISYFRSIAHDVHTTVYTFVDSTWNSLGFVVHRNYVPLSQASAQMQSRLWSVLELSLPSVMLPNSPELLPYLSILLDALLLLFSFFFF